MERLRRRPEFLAAARGRKASTQAFLLQARNRDDSGPPRVGLTVSRRVGTAVERNRVRRRLREAVRLSAARQFHEGHDYVVVARRAALSISFDRLVTELRGALRRLHGASSGEDGAA